MRIFIILMVLGAIAYAPIYWAAAPALRRHIGTLFVISFVTLIFGGLFAPPGLFFFLLCPLVMVTLTVSRLDAVCRFILLGALIPNPDWPLVIGGTYLIKVSMLDMLGVGLVLATLLKPDHSRVAKVRGFTLEDMIVILFFLALNIAPVRFSEGATGLMRTTLSGALHLAIPYLMLRRHVRSLKEFRIVVGCIAAASGILSVYAIYESFHGWSMFVTINAHLGDVGGSLRNLITRGGAMRASTTMSGALMLGCYLSIGWVAIICSRDLVRTRMLWMAGCALILAGELAAQSRGNLLCVALAVPILLAANRRVGLAVVMSVSVAAGTALLIAAARFSQRIAGFLNLSPDRAEGADYDYRQLLLRRGLEEAAKHRWTGTSMNNILAQLGDIRQGEGVVDFVNTYLYIYLVAGIPFLVVSIIVILMMFFKLSSLSIRKKAQDFTIVRAFAIASLVSMMIALFFMSFIDRVPVLVVFALIASRLCRRQNGRRLNPLKS